MWVSPKHGVIELRGPLPPTAWEVKSFSSFDEVYARFRFPAEMEIAFDAFLAQCARWGNYVRLIEFHKSTEAAAIHILMTGEGRE